MHCSRCIIAWRSDGVREPEIAKSIPVGRPGGVLRCVWHLVCNWFGSVVVCLGWLCVCVCVCVCVCMCERVLVWLCVCHMCCIGVWGVVVCLGWLCVCVCVCVCVCMCECMCMCVAKK